MSVKRPLSFLILLILLTLGVSLLFFRTSVANANPNIYPCTSDEGIVKIHRTTYAFRTYQYPEDFYCEKIPNGVRIHTRSMVFFEVSRLKKVRNLRVLNLFCYSVNPSICASKPKRVKVTFKVYNRSAAYSREYNCSVLADGIGQFRMEMSKYVPPHLVPTAPVFGISFERFCAEGERDEDKKVTLLGPKTVVVLINDSFSRGTGYSEMWVYDGHFTFDLVKN